MTPKPKHGGTRPGAGRPPVADVRVSASITVEQRAFAAKLGGTASAGIRRALEILMQR